MDGVFPKGMMVGAVISVHKQTAGLFQQINVLPAVTLNTTEQVLVVGARENAPRK
jgi:rod shape-determining protein MreC